MHLRGASVGVNLEEEHQDETLEEQASKRCVYELRERKEMCVVELFQVDAAAKQASSRGVQVRFLEKAGSLRIPTGKRRPADSAASGPVEKGAETNFAGKQLCFGFLF